VKPGRQAVLAVQEQLEEQVVPEELERSVRLDLPAEPEEPEQREEQVELVQRVELAVQVEQEQRVEQVVPEELEQ